jgi:hypothetical protein
MRKILWITLFAIIATILLAACSSSNSDAPAQAVENYLNTLVAMDENRLPTLVCGDWEEEALIELDSLRAVTARLENVSCTQTGTDGETVLVNCSGKLIATYNEEDQELDLSAVTYQIVEQDGDWLVCGTR